MFKNTTFSNYFSSSSEFQLLPVLPDFLNILILANYGHINFVSLKIAKKKTIDILANLNILFSNNWSFAHSTISILGDNCFELCNKTVPQQTSYPQKTYTLHLTYFAPSYAQAFPLPLKGKILHANIKYFPQKNPYTCWK